MSLVVFGVNCWTHDPNLAAILPTDNLSNRSLSGDALLLARAGSEVLYWNGEDSILIMFKKKKEEIWIMRSSFSLTTCN